MPRDDVLRPMPGAFVDDRGELWTLLEGIPFSSVLRITSREGAIRANHYHKEDYHYCYLESGKMEYLERPVGSKGEPDRHLIEAGQLFYTPAGVEHAMRFLEDSVFWCFSRNSRKQENYENDTVRVNLIG